VPETEAGDPADVAPVVGVVPSAPETTGAGADGLADVAPVVGVVPSAPETPGAGADGLADALCVPGGGSCEG
jgi:hypothetical protein